MEKIAEDLETEFNQLRTYIANVEKQIIKYINQNTELKKSFHEYELAIEDYSFSRTSTYKRDIYKAVSKVCGRAKNIADTASSITYEQVSGGGYIEGIQKRVTSVERALESYIFSDNVLSDDYEQLNKLYREIFGDFRALKEEYKDFEYRQKNLVVGLESKVDSLFRDVDSIQAKMTSEIDAIKIAYNDMLLEIEQKRSQIDDILGHVSGRAIAGDFANSAAEELKSANQLRWISLACMAIIVFIVGYTFIDTTSKDFQWENSIVRIFLAFILSVPAAYLAKESAKHREQQYTHLQTSLDLKAITPYIASLPETEQHKIKVDIAGRLFASRDYSRVSADPYPVNTHELIMEIIKKLELKKDSDKH